MSFANLAADVRAMEPGHVVCRAIMRPVDAWREADADQGKAFNAHITRLRAATGFTLVVESLAPHLTAAGQVLRCYTVTRLS